MFVCHAVSAHGDQERALGLLELELQDVLSYLVAPGN